MAYVYTFCTALHSTQPLDSPLIVYNLAIGRLAFAFASFLSPHAHTNKESVILDYMILVLRLGSPSVFDSHPPHVDG